MAKPKFDPTLRVSKSWQPSKADSDAQKPDELPIGPGFALPVEAVTQTFAILAKRGAGKTYTASRMAEEMASRGVPFVVVDPVGVWWGLRVSADGKGAGVPVYILGGEHADLPLSPATGAVVAEAIAGPGMPHNAGVVLDVSLMRKGEMVEFCIAFFETLYRKNRRALHVFLDEADAFAPQRPAPGHAMRLLGAVDDVVRRGRARGLGITLITQRAAVLSKDVLTQVEVLVTLRTIGPQDRKAIETWVDAHGDEKEKRELLGSLASLEIGEAWVWSPAWLKLFCRVKIGKRSTFDSSATPKYRSGEIVRSATPALPGSVGLSLEDLGAELKAAAETAAASDPKKLAAELKAMQAVLKASQAECARFLEERNRLADTNRLLSDEVIDARAQVDRANAVKSQAIAGEIDAPFRLREGLELLKGLKREVTIAVGPIEELAEGLEALSEFRGVVADHLTKIRETFARIEERVNPSVKIEDITKINSVREEHDAETKRLKDFGLLRQDWGEGDRKAHFATLKEHERYRGGLDPSTPSETSSRVGLTGPEARILDAIAWLRSINGQDWQDQAAVAFVAGYTVNGGAFNNPRGALRSRNLIAYSSMGSSQLALTPEGEKLARVEEGPVAVTAADGRVIPPDEQLRARIYAKLPGPERRLLQELAAVWPNSLTGEELARRCSYAPNGGAFNNPRSRLRSLRLIEYVPGELHKKNRLRACDHLFPGRTRPAET